MKRPELKPHPRCPGAPSRNGGPRVCCGFRRPEYEPCYRRADPFPPVDVNAPHPFYERAARFFDAAGRAWAAGATVDQAIAAAHEATRD